MFENVLVGVSFSSDNRGVNALGIGALIRLKLNNQSSDVTVINFSKEERIVEHDIWMHGSYQKVNVYHFSSKTLLKALSALWFNRFPNKLALIIKQAKTIYTVNEGDSFSDIYGLKRLLFWCLIAMLPIIGKKRLVFLPQTIGPFNTFIGKMMSKYILKSAQVIYVRDEQGKKYLEEGSISHTLSCDMAVFMPPKKVLIEVPEKCVGININGLLYYESYGIIQGRYSHYKKIIVDLIHEALKNNYKVLLVPHTYNVNSPGNEDDLKATREIYDSLKHPDVLIIDSDYDAQELKYFISKCEVFYGSRMHSCIAALSSTVPTVGLAYSYKFTGTFGLFNQSQWVFDIENITEAEIPAFIIKITRIFDDLQNIKKELIDMKSEMEKKYLEGK
ncbi:polysaccharide pyruvyl transferase family protein [Pelosinus fermentans]|uniref:Polysaccharide pyruvyl transferase n=1 Tax=Pelosinus fermentans JBW45 TaxID=1192197 RepID=I9DDR4_9FIRM|nr:polysaccharide pyruvyl transferase family protein [Pelosinus fermentans]AJQ26013.1 polysaccharide pyruvyl transferase [Pelosinus fermentans JBW45]